MSEFPVGSCQCGAVYSCDATGHNVGAAIVETLVYACNDHEDLAWELMPEDDYLTGRIENYDEQKHQVVATKNIDGRAVRGVLYFVRLHADIQEVASRVNNRQESGDGVMQNHDSQQTMIPVEPAPEKDREKKRASKLLVKKMVMEEDLDGLVALCLDDKKTLRLMQRLLYDPDEQKRWRVSWLLGKVCARVSTREPGSVSELLHRLFEACSDSAATPWGMVETIGHVVSMRPDIFGAFTRHLLNYIAEDSTRNQTIWALAEIGNQRPDLIRNTPFYNLFHFLQHPQTQIRGQVVRLMSAIGAGEVISRLRELEMDEECFVYYKDGMPVTTKISTVAAEAVVKIEGENKE